MVNKCSITPVDGMHPDALTACGHSNGGDFSAAGAMPPSDRSRKESTPI